MALEERSGPDWLRVGLIIWAALLCLPFGAKFYFARFTPKAVLPASTVANSDCAPERVGKSQIRQIKISEESIDKVFMTSENREHLDFSRNIGSAAQLQVRRFPKLGPEYKTQFFVESGELACPTNQACMTNLWVNEQLLGQVCLINVKAGSRYAVELEDAAQLSAAVGERGDFEINLPVKDLVQPVRFEFKFYHQ